ncbi:MAG: hypothetical protein R3C14_54350 [Caldilineaceae bacterium]
MFEILAFGIGILFMVATGSPIVLIGAVVLYVLARPQRRAIEAAGRNPDGGCVGGGFLLILIVIGMLLCAVALMGESGVSGGLHSSVNGPLHDYRCSLPNNAQPGTALFDWLEEGCK